MEWLSLKGEYVTSCDRRDINKLKLTVKVWLIQNLWFYYLLDDVLKGDQTQHLVERISLPLIVHFLDNGQVRLSCVEDRDSLVEFPAHGSLHRSLRLSVWSAREATRLKNTMCRKQWPKLQNTKAQQLVTSNTQKQSSILFLVSSRFILLTE